MDQEGLSYPDWRTPVGASEQLGHDKMRSLPNLYSVQLDGVAGGGYMYQGDWRERGRQSRRPAHKKTATAVVGGGGTGGQQRLRRESGPESQGDASDSGSSSAGSDEDYHHQGNSRGRRGQRRLARRVRRATRRVIKLIPEIEDFSLIDRYSRVLFPVSFLVFNILYWTFYIF